MHLSDVEPNFTCTRCGKSRRRHTAQVFTGEDGGWLGAIPNRKCIGVPAKIKNAEMAVKAMNFSIPESCPWMC
jgi:hypothetical protein